MNSKAEIQFAKVNTNGKTPRSRRTHHKTKTGCNNCKLRKIKCDEQLPKCGACLKRGNVCIRSAENPSKFAEAPDAYPSDSLDLRIDLVAMKLFHHFQQSTAGTLAGGGRMWDGVIPVSLEHECLMHAILSMAAAHLKATHAVDQTYTERELQHQSAAIKGLQSTLAGGVTKENSDAIFASSLLLYHHAWTTVDDDNSSFTVNLPCSLVDLIPIGTCIKGMVMETGLLRTSMWQEAVAYSPRIALMLCVQHTTVPQELEEAFKKQYLLVRPDELDSWQYEAFMAECRRLIPVMSVLKLRDRGLLDIAPITTSIVRYLFTWPVLLAEGFFEMERQEDSLARLALLHFFTAVAKSGIESMWWARQRTRFTLDRISRDFDESGLQVLDMFASPHAPGEQCDIV